MPKRLFKPVRDMKMHTKLLFSYILVVLLPVILIGYFLITRTTKEFMNQTDYINQANFQQIKDNISNQLNNYIQVSDNILSEELLQSYLEKEYTSEISYEDKYFEYYNVIDTYRKKFVFTSMGDIKIIIYTDNSTIITDDDTIRFTDDRIKNESWYEDAVNAKGANVVIKPFLNSDGKMVFAIERLLSFRNNSRFVNVLRMEIPENLLYKMIKKEASYKSIYLLNNEDYIITSSDRNSVGKHVDEITELKTSLKEPGKAANSLEAEARRVFVDHLSYKSPISDCRIAAIVSSEAMLGNIKGIVQYSLFICLLSFGIAVVLVLIFSNKISKRIKLLAKNMGRIRDGKFDVFVSYEEKDEIGELSRSFKNMVERINNLISEVYIAEMHVKDLEIKKKEAEINALQSQINPHFLFNTMESIRMNLLERNDVETSEIIQKFAKLLRKSIDWSSDIITLQQEIDLIETYLKIQKYRYEKKLDYEINIDESVKYCIIPKFSLQPIVENAIYHGIEMKGTKGKVSIFTILLEDCIKIIVEDDGIGMDEVQLEDLRHQIYNNQTKGGSSRIGLRNVHQRLQLNYGENYGLKIDSKKGVGTRTEIMIPLTYEREEKSHV